MQFLYPNVLWMLLIPIILLLVLIATNKNSMQMFFSEEILGKLRVNTKSLRHETRNFIFFAALILMVLALARPVANKQEFEAKQELIPIVIALDISKSMQATDIYPNRLELAKRKLKYIIQNIQNSAVAVILFARDSFVLSPITQDITSLLYMVNHLDQGMNFDNGSNIYSAIQTTQKLTKDYENKNIILLSDGGDEQNYQKELDFAKKNKINIYTIGLASQEGSPIPDDKGGYLTNDDKQIVLVKLNEALKTLGINSGGGYIDYSLGNKDVDMILSDIYTKSKKDQFEAQKVKHYIELFYYPVILALILLLIGFSSLPRRTTTMIMLFFLVAIPQNSDANIFDFQKIESANKAYENKEYKKAERNFQDVARNAQGYYNYANALYKQKKYKQAIKQYEKVVTSNKELEFKKLHNMGNSFAYSGQFDKAEEFYKKALQIKEDKQTKENLEKIQDLNNKQEQNKQDQKNNQENNDQQNDNDKEKKENQDNNDQQNKNDKEKNDNKDKNDQQEQKQEEKNEEEQSDNNKNKQNQQEQKMQQQKIEQTQLEQISQKEEKKWMERLEDKQAPVMLHKVPSNTKENDVKNPW